MPVIEVDTHIDRPPQEVFDYLARFENLAVYDAFVTASGQVGDGPVGLGTRGWGKTRFMGQQFDWTVEYTEFDPPRRMASRAVEGERDLRVAFTLEPVEGGTRVTQRLEVTRGLGVVGKLPAPLLHAMLTRSARANLKALTEQLMRPHQAQQRLTGAGAQATESGSARPMPHVPGVEHRFVQLPGLRMHVALAGAGSPVLLIHGSPMHWWEWHRVIPGLAEHHRVICPDLRGMGWSEAPSTGYDRAHILADYTALLDALAIDRVDVISHDMGAIPGFDLAWEHPERVERHLMLSVGPLYMPFRPSMLARFRHLWHQYVLAVPGLGPALTRSGRQRVIRHMLQFHADQSRWSPEEQEVFLAPLREPARARAKSALYRQLVLPGIGLLLRGYYRKGQLQPQTKVLLGERDPVMEPALVRELLRGTEHHARYPVEVVSVPGAAHHLLAEAPETVLDEALRFLAR